MYLRAHTPARAGRLVALGENRSMAATVSCPICGKPVPLDDANMPFCSDRCRLIDLGNWASEKYVISSPTSQSELDETEEPEGSEGQRQ